MKRETGGSGLDEADFKKEAHKPSGFRRQKKSLETGHRQRKKEELCRYWIG
jgi:hypothetical protein